MSLHVAALRCLLALLGLHSHETVSVLVLATLGWAPSLVHVCEMGLMPVVGCVMCAAVGNYAGADVRVQDLSGDWYSHSGMSLHGVFDWASDSASMQMSIVAVL